MVITQLPNILSVSRIVLSVGLLFLFNHAALFITFYILAGITDALDGFIARKYHITSVLGTKLDSIGDFFFFSVLIIYLLSRYTELLAPFLWPVLVVFAVRLFSVIAGVIRYRKLTMVHTIANKASGLSVFALPALLWAGWHWYLYLVIILVMFAATEEFLIIVSGKKEMDLNRKSIFVKQQY